MTAPKQPESNDLAIAALVLGILSLVGLGPLTGIPAVITGWMGLKNPHNKGMAIAGLVMGAISIVFVLLLLLLFFVLLLLGALAGPSLEDSDFPGTSEPSDSGYFQRRA